MTRKEGVFDCLEGFRAKEVLEQSQEKLVTKFENDKGKTQQVTQTANEIRIKWSAKD